MTMSQNSTKFSCYLKFLLLLFVLSLCSNYTFAQGNITVTGKVIDPDTKAPLANVSVQVKGTNKGVVTNDAGIYSISAPAGSTLLFTYLTNAPEQVKITKDGTFNVSISSKPKSLDEVVVIGYGSRKKKDITGALSTVGSKDIEKSTSMTPELALQGKAAGVFIESGGGNPGARPTIRIRGTNTFGFAEPLYVIDGVPIYEGGAGVTDGAIGDIRSSINIFSTINPADIESMTVLKDASAAAIYGVRASNGVILITTKRGRSGRARVDFTSSYGTQNIAKTRDVLNTQQYFALLRESYANNPDAGVSFEQKFGPVYTSNNPRYAGNEPTYDWQNELKNKNAPIKDVNIKVSGGTENFSYYFSTGYSKTESPLKANNLERYSVAANIESKISKYVSAGLNVRGVQQDALDNTNGSLDDMMSTIPFQSIYSSTDPLGFTPTTNAKLIDNPIPQKDPITGEINAGAYDPNRVNSGPAKIFDGGGNAELLWGNQTRYNAFALQKLNKTSYRQTNFLGSAFIQLEPLAGLKIKGVISGNLYLNNRTTFINNDNYRFRQPPSNPFTSGMDPFGKGTLGERNTTTTNLNKELVVSYNRTIKTNHSLDVVLSASEQFADWKVNDISSQVNFIDPQYWSITNRPPNTGGFSSILQEDALIGYMARGSYKFKDKYYLDGTIRRDGSSRLAPGNKFDNFPSFGAAWRISSENFFPKTSFINDLKLRGGWGKLGNFQSAGYYKYLTTISSSPDYAIGSGNGNSTGTPLQAASLPGFANKKLTWEKATTASFGFDAVLFNNSFTFTAEYYSKITNNIIQSVSLPPNTGIQDPADLNVASVKNNGIELQLGYNKRFGNVNFNASANLTTVTNRVLKLNGGTPFGGEGGRVEEGKSMFYLWGYKVGGVFQSQEEIDKWRQVYTDVNIGQERGNLSSGKQYKPGDLYFVDVNGNPKDPKDLISTTPDSLINTNDRTYLGKTIPGYFYGFSIGADYKGFDISIFLQGVGDVQRYNGIRSGLEGMSGPANQFATTLNRWTPSKPSATMPRAVFGDPTLANRFSSRFVENASYLRLKNVQLGYTIPKTFLSKLAFIQNFRAYVSGVNLLTFTSYTGLDPENEFIPPTRQILFGLNVTF